MREILYSFGLLAAFALGWYLSSRSYEPQLASLREWCLRLIDDYNRVADTAIHMVRDDDLRPDPVFEAERDAEPQPELKGPLNSFVAQIRHPEARQMLEEQALRALRDGMPEGEILRHLEAGEDPLWAKSMVGG